MNIQKAEMDDLPAIMAIYKSAQDFMIKTGNPTQWGHSYPTRDLVKKDICKRSCYLICDDDSATKLSQPTKTLKMEIG